ncbi:hypothetical protein BC830DRAFT_857397 [Chytriomyces sp. MP71]|nr:hypothetical protein BC830DRAFT_857397 [Chytriomyces sp. MP71]
MAGTDPHAASSEKGYQSHFLSDVGALKDMFQDATAKTGDTVGDTTTSGTEPINKIQDSNISNDAFKGAKTQLDSAEQWTKNDHQSQVLPDPPQEQKKERGIFGAVKDIVQDVTAKSRDVLDHATSSATEPSNKIQGKSNEASEVVKTQIEEQPSVTRSPRLSQGIEGGTRNHWIH